jgi:hypothetical protein
VDLEAYGTTGSSAKVGLRITMPERRGEFVVLVGGTVFAGSWSIRK